MRTPWLLTASLAAGLAMAQAGCGEGAATDQSVQALRELDTEEAAFVRLLNEYRVANGRPPVVATRLLNQVAYDHSLDMGTRRYFSHNSPEGTTPFQRMSRAGYSGGRAENIAAGNADAQRTFTQWRNSPGHNTNMLASTSRAIGIGRAYVAGSPYRYYWTNVFGSVVDDTAINGSTPTTPPQPPAGACVSGLSGSGAAGASGQTCLGRHSFNVVAGRTYVISTCGRSSGDTFLVVTGACACSNDDACDLGSECRCTATATGVAVLCASTYGNESASWSYAVTPTDGGACSLVGGAPSTPVDAGTAPRDAGTAPRDAGVAARDAGVAVRDTGVAARDAGVVGPGKDGGGVAPLPDPPEETPDAGPRLREAWASESGGCRAGRPAAKGGVRAVAAVAGAWALGLWMRRRRR